MGSWWLLPAAGPARDSDLVRGVGSGGRQRSRGGDPTRGAVLVLRTRAELARPWVPARNLRTGCTPGTCRERGTRSALRPFPRLVRFTGPRCGAGPRQPRTGTWTRFAESPSCIALFNLCRTDAHKLLLPQF
ncbi:hypothetical protein H671_1g1067 [Cricetulus griseus]|uniref:Uncharacterized protein n=1 Tax=Cricetulus griseus TaxID=10029 RepID=A0A061IR08_CRIGR|nr:hypothetical protein H671_1g1067 [Cricetulus griseus]